MKTETAVQAFWEISLSCNGLGEALTYEQAQDRLRPLYVNALHPSLALQRQVEALSTLLVRGPRGRMKKPKKMPQNIVHLPIAQKKAAAA